MQDDKTCHFKSYLNYAPCQRLVFVTAGIAPARVCLGMLRSGGPYRVHSMYRNHVFCQKNCNAYQKCIVGVFSCKLVYIPLQQLFLYTTILCKVVPLKMSKPISASLVWDQWCLPGMTSEYSAYKYHRETISYHQTAQHPDNSIPVWPGKRSIPGSKHTCFLARLLHLSRKGAK